MNTQLKHIRSMAEMILSELDKLEGAQPVTKPKAEPKFKVGDRVVWRSALNEKVLTIVSVGLDQFNMDAHAAGRVTFPNETGVYFQYDVTTARGDIATFGEKALKMYVEPKAGPKFKVGDRVIKTTGTSDVLTIVEIQPYPCGTGWNCILDKGCQNEDHLTLYINDKQANEVWFGKAEPKFKVGDRVKVQNTYYYQGGEKLGIIVFVGEAKASRQVYGVEFSNGTDICFHEADLSEPEATVDKAEFTQIWHRGEPPHNGWWNASNTCNTETWGRVWRWWDGKCWSASAYPRDSMATVKQMANRKTPTNDIKWTDYWPENARVPRIDPGFKK